MMLGHSDKQQYNTTEAKHQIDDDLSDQRVQNTENKNHTLIHNRRKGVKRLLDPLRSTSTPATASPHSPIAFTATLTNDIFNLGAKQTLKFDRVVTNVGGGYHSSHGNFFAPRDGVYVFALTAMPNRGHFEHLQIVKDGVQVAVAYAGSKSGEFQSTATLVTLTLSKGYEVWVETFDASWHGTGSLHGDYYTSFSGWVLS